MPSREIEVKIKYVDNGHILEWSTSADEKGEYVYHEGTEVFSSYSFARKRAQIMLEDFEKDG